MFVCLDCGFLFEDPTRYEDSFSDFSPVYRNHWEGCPKCAGTFAETYRCDNCGEYITSDYIKVGNDRYCENCYTSYILGNE